MLHVDPQIDACTSAVGLLPADTCACCIIPDVKLKTWDKEGYLHSIEHGEAGLVNQ